MGHISDVGFECVRKCARLACRILQVDLDLGGKRRCWNWACDCQGLTEKEGRGASKLSAFDWPHHGGDACAHLCSSHTIHSGRKAGRTHGERGRREQQRSSFRNCRRVAFERSRKTSTDQPRKKTRNGSF